MALEKNADSQTISDAVSELDGEIVDNFAVAEEYDIPGVAENAVKTDGENAVKTDLGKARVASGDLSGSRSVDKQISSAEVKDVVSDVENGPEEVTTVAEWITKFVPDPKQQLDGKHVASMMQEAIQKAINGVRELFTKLAAAWRERLQQAELGNPAPLSESMVGADRGVESLVYFTQVEPGGNYPTAETFGNALMWQMQLPFDDRVQLSKELIIGGLVDSREAYDKSMNVAFGSGEYDPSEVDPRIATDKDPDGKYASIRSLASQYQALQRAGKDYFLLEDAEDLYDRRRSARISGSNLEPALGSLAQEMKTIVNGANPEGLDVKKASLYAQFPELKGVTVPQSEGEKAQAKAEAFAVNNEAEVEGNEYD